MDKQKMLQVAMLAANKAGEYLVNLTNAKVDSFEGKDIKLEADRKSEQIIIETLNANTEFPILTEESGEIGEINHDMGLHWIIDPIDGTFNYFKQLDLCCVSIALYDGNTPVIGVINQFMCNKIYCGVIDEGASCNGEAISTSNITEVGKAAIATGFPVYRDFSENAIKDFLFTVDVFKKIRMFGTAALSVTKVAAGQVDSYMEDDIMLWDVAAGVAILEAAGGCAVLDQSKRYKWGRKVKCFANESLKEDYLHEVSNK